MSKLSYTQERISHWDEVARKMDSWAGWGAYYNQRLTQIYQFNVMPGQRVLEIGCGQGDLLAALKPSIGVGVDFSYEMIKRAKNKHPELKFIQADAHKIDLDEKFDVVILSDIVDDLWDVQKVFEQIKKLVTARTRLIINLYSRLWEKPITLAQRMGLAKPLLDQNWLSVEDIVNLLYIADFEIIWHTEEILWPIWTPILSTLANRFLVKLWPFNIFALTSFIAARPKSKPKKLIEEPSVSVIIAARNEAGNIPAIFKQVPEMGRRTELIFVEGHSKDDTYSVIERYIAKHPERSCKLLRQNGTGKCDALHLGFNQASGDIIIILDADVTVSPEDLPRFYETLRSGKAEFVNGVRFVYPMEKKAMRFLNILGNKFFGMAFSWLLGQPVKDTLCGTKAIWKDDYNLILKSRQYFGDFDPFGDFELLFGAGKLNLKIVDLPIHYYERTYGTTNIKRWLHGWLLIKMVIFAARRIKFI